MKYGIVGAGPSGLTMSLFLKHPSIVLEANSTPGGHGGSHFDKGYTFDNGPHIMFSKNKTILDFMIKSLGNNVRRCRRNNKISFKGRLIKYPFENDLKSLPLLDNFDCLYHYIFNPYKRKYALPKNLRQWFLKHFGKSICEKYLFPYNEKVWNMPVQKLSMLWADRIPNPPAADIIKSAIGYETEGYLHQLYYHYPLRGGYQAISEAWAKKANVVYNFEVKKIVKRGKKFILSNGANTVECDQVISTMPIHELVKIVNIPIPKRILEAVNDLIVDPIYAICLGIKGEDKNKFTAVYFPEANFLVNRISFPKTFSPHNAPKGCYSIQAEITCRKNSKIWKEKDDTILNHVIQGLIKRRIIKKRGDIVYRSVIRCEYAYVVYDTDYAKNVKIIRDWFPKQDIHLVGRFSYFEYINVDAVIARSLKIASKLNKSQVKLEGAKIVK